MALGDEAARSVGEGQTVTPSGRRRPAQRRPDSFTSDIWKAPERDAYLRKLCTDGVGHSARQIAALMTEAFPPYVFTKASIVSRVHRSGYKLPIPASQRRIDPDYEPSWWNAKERPLPAFVRPVDIVEDPGGPGIVMLNAGMFQCRWVVEEAGEMTRVCGEPTKPESSYCETCHDKVYLRVRLADLDAHYTSSDRRRIVDRSRTVDRLAYVRFRSGNAKARLRDPFSGS
jgi:hypothetical protein